MAAEDEPLFQTIAQTIVDAIEGRWATAYVTASIEPNGLALEGRCYHDETDITGIPVRIMPQLGRLFVELRNAMHSGGEQLWQTATVNLISSGGFEFEFSY
jgi:hypothetical protein